MSIGTPDPFTNVCAFTNAFTLNLWVNVYGLNGYLAGCENTNVGDSNGWYLVDSGNNLYFGPGPQGRPSISTVPSGVSFDNLDNMITITGDGTNQPIIYLNGIAVQ